MAAFTADGTYSPAVDAWHWFTVIGGGGSGAAAKVSAIAAGLTVACTGGNGGSVRYGWVFLKASETYTVTIGAGGALQSVPGGNTGIAGATGGESKLTGGDLSADIVAKGGTAGGFHYGSTSGKDYSGGNAITLENAANAAGSGAGVEALGGKGGKFDVDVNTDTGFDYFFSTGGGAANIYGVAPAGIRGGDVHFTIRGDENRSAASGGGGVGGTGGDISADENTGGLVDYGSSGGGSAGDGVASSSEDAGDRDVPGGSGTGTTEYLEPGGEGGGVEYIGTDPFASTFGGAGGGGGAVYHVTTGEVGIAGGGGRYAGGAGVTTADNAPDISAGTGGANGGGGGGVTAYSSVGNSGAGGSGVVVLQGFFSPSN